MDRQRTGTALGRQRIGTALVVAGLVVLAATLGVSAALAPDLDPPSTGAPSTGAPSTGAPSTDAPGGAVGSGGTGGATGGGANGTTTPGNATGTPGSNATGPGESGDPATEAGTLLGLQLGAGTGHTGGQVALVRDGQKAWRADLADSYFDVTPLADGRVLAAFLRTHVEDCAPLDAPCARTGYQIIDPRAAGGPRVDEEWSVPIVRAKNREVHDVEMLPTGEVLVADMNRERLVAVEDGQVTWQWNASEVYEAPPDPTARDWLHLNDVDVIAEDRYLVSVRNANQLLVLERTADTARVVEVINADTDTRDGSCTSSGQLADQDGDGDVRCGDPDVMRHQHNPQWLGDGAVLVADSDNDRVVELHRGADGTWAVAWSLDRAGGIEFGWPRDADRLPNGNTLITDTLSRRIVEVDRTGAVVWQYRMQRIPYEADRLPRGELANGTTYGTHPTNVAPTPTEKPGDAGDGSTTTTAAGTDAGSAPTAGTDPTAPTGQAPGGGGWLPDLDVPLLSAAMVGLRMVYPDLPLWFREPQLLLTLLSTASVVVGGVVRWLG